MGRGRLEQTAIGSNQAWFTKKFDKYLHSFLLAHFFLSHAITHLLVFSFIVCCMRLLFPPFCAQHITHIFRFVARFYECVELEKSNQNANFIQCFFLFSVEDQLRGWTREEWEYRIVAPRHGRWQPNRTADLLWHNHGQRNFVEVVLCYLINMQISCK